MTTHPKRARCWRTMAALLICATAAFVGFSNRTVCATETVHWTAVKGELIYTSSYPVHGTRGVPDPANSPGSRSGAASWTDKSGNLWMFGGDFVFSSAWNDLWKFDPVTNNWTWMKGSDLSGQAGVYGTMKNAQPDNTPGARSGAASWTDRWGNFWLFGGQGDSGELYNDLWKYEPSSGNWTWIKGSNIPNQPGLYGTLGIPTPANTPGARSESATWVDKLGNLWLFGGDLFNDL